MTTGVYRLHYHVKSEENDVVHTAPSAAAARVLRRQLQQDGADTIVYECSTMSPECPLKVAGTTEESEDGRSGSERKQSGDQGSTR